MSTGIETAARQKVRNAIQESEQTNQIVTITAVLDSDEWYYLLDWLNLACEDGADTRHASNDMPVREFWADGWRVHVRALAAV